MPEGRDALLRGAQYQTILSPAVLDWVPGLGYMVYKVDSGATAADALFTVTGRNLITLITGTVSVAIGGEVTSASVNTVTANIILASSATVLDGAAAGTVVIVEGDGTALVAGTGSSGVGAAASGQFGNIVVDGDNIERNYDGTAGAGVIEWWLYYIPLEASASITSAA